MEKLLDILADRFMRHRMLVAVALVAITALAIRGNMLLEFDNSPRDVFRTKDTQFQQLEQLFADFGSDDNDCLLLVSSDELFTPKVMRRLRGLVDEIAAVEGVAWVRSLLDVTVFDEMGRPVPLVPPDDATPEQFQQARERAMKHPLVAGQVLSADGDQALLVVRIAGESLSVDEIDPVVEQLDAISERWADQGLFEVGVTGVPPMRMEIFQMVRSESSRFILIGFGVAFVLAWILLRRLWAVLIVSAAPTLGAIWTLGALGLVGEKINVINTVLPTLVLVVGFTDAVHLMVDIRHSRRAGHAPLHAARAALFHLALACALTSLTTAVGFASLAVAEVDVIRRFGLACAAGAVLVFLSVITVVPLLSSTRLGRYVQGKRSDLLEGQIARFECVIDWIVAHGGRVALVGGAVTLLLGLSFFRLRPDNRLTEFVPHENESFLVMQDLDESFGGMLTASVIVEWDEDRDIASPDVLAAIGEVHQRFDAEPLLHLPLSVINLLESLPDWMGDLSDRARWLSQIPEDVVRRMVRSDLRRAVVTVRLEDLGTGVYEPVFRRFEEELAALEAKYPGVALELTGTVVVASRNINQMITDLAKSLALAAIVIFTVMSLVFRSLRIGLISVLPNMFPMVATAAVLVLSGRPLQLTSVIVFSICLGIAVDDTIHFLSRIKRELHHKPDLPRAIRRAFIAVGAALVTTTIVLVSGFGATLSSDLPSSVLFGWLSCVGISSALVGDLVILPALVALFVRPEHFGVAPVEEKTDHARFEQVEQAVRG